MTQCRFTSKCLRSWSNTLITVQCRLLPPVVTNPKQRVFVFSFLGHLYIHHSAPIFLLQALKSRLVPLQLPEAFWKVVMDIKMYTCFLQKLQSGCFCADTESASYKGKLVKHVEFISLILEPFFSIVFLTSIIQEASEPQNCKSGSNKAAQPISCAETGFSINQLSQGPLAHCEGERIHFHHDIL